MELLPIHDHSARLLSIVDRLITEVRPGARSNASLDSALEKDLGLDSLTRVELLTRVESAFGLLLPDDLLGSAETPQARCFRRQR
jgi:acyl carrier protein